MNIMSVVGSTMGQVFGELFDEAILHHKTVNKLGSGSLSETFTPYTVKAQIDNVSTFQQHSLNLPSGSARIYILQLNAPQVPETDDIIEKDGKAWKLITASEDPAKVAWDWLASPVAVPT